MKVLKMTYLKTATRKDFDKVRDNLYKRYMVIDSKLNRILDIDIGYKGRTIIVTVRGEDKKDVFSGAVTIRGGNEEDGIFSALEKAGFKFDKYYHENGVIGMLEIVAKRLTRRKFKIFY